MFSTELTTQRLYIRRLTEQDWTGAFEYLSDPEVVRYEPYSPLTRQECREFAAYAGKTGNFWAILLAESEQLIGQVFLMEKECLNWETGYVFNRAYHGHGYATEAVKKLLGFVFSRENAHRVYANCNPDNTPSWRLLERLGFRREGTLRKNIYFKKDATGNPLWQDTYIYGMVKDEWEAKP
jgi:Acetyltransferases, including N-acetylases of ribosomal proteins